MQHVCIADVYYMYIKPGEHMHPSYLYHCKKIILITLLVNSMMTQAQLKISGTVLDSITSIPIPHATIKLQNDSSKNTTAVISDSLGQFAFPPIQPGRYTVSYSYIGIRSISSPFRLDHDSVFQLQLDSRSRPALKTVTVTSSRPLIERRIDRMIFNVESSIAAKGMDLVQALELTPMLRVDVNGISIVGKSGVGVMINDRILNLSGAELVNYLRSLRSDDIARIEVITTPPAKYEAQGNSGLINIIVKKNPNIGWSGSLASTYAQTTYPAYADNGSLNYQSGRLAASLRLRQYHKLTHPTEKIDVVGQQSILSDDSRKDLDYGEGANLSMDYKIGGKASIGYIYDLGERIYDMDIRNSTIYQTSYITDSTLTTLTHQHNPTFTHALNVYYDQKLDSNGKKLSTGFNFFSTTPRTTVGFQTSSDKTGQTGFIKNTSDLDYRIWSAQSDLSLLYKWAAVETGAKFTRFDNNSDIRYYNLIEPDYIIDPSKSNIFKYLENNIAAYLSTQKEISPKWSAKGGLRYEYSTIDGYSPDNGEPSQYHYGKLFPSAYLTYKPNAAHTFSLNYSKRINRPNFRALNPFRWYSNPYTYSTGNPLLNPSYNHNLELAWLYKGIFSLTLYGQKLVNGYGRITTVNDALKVVDYRNYLTQYNTGMEATLGLKFFPWWENRDFLSLNFSSSSSSLPSVLPQNGFALYYSTYNTFTLSRVIAIFLNFWQSLPATEGNTHTNNRYSLASGCKIALPGNKFQLNLSVDDILRSTVSRGKIYYQDFTQYFDNYYDSRRLSCSLTYTFGKSKIRGSRKQVDFRETQRAN